MTPQEYIDESNRLIAERAEWDTIWAACARLVLPMQDREFRRGGALDARKAVEGWVAGPSSVDKLNERFDITAVLAADRLATGLLSLVTPDNEKWMNLGIRTPLGPVDPSDEETRWLERQRDYLLGIRYNPLTGWQLANSAAMRGMVVFGSSAYFLEEAYGKHGQNDARVPYVFTPLPLSENYLTVDGQGHLDGDYRRFRMSARQAATRFGAQLSPKVQALASDPRQWATQVELLHVVTYRQETGAGADPMRKSLVESVYLEVETKHIIRRGGFNYWPVINYVWNPVPGSAYGESPVFLVMAEIKGSNILAKNALLSAQQLTAPPVATMDDARQAKPNLNPRAVNFGMLDAQGRLKIQPILTAQNPSLIAEVLNVSREQIKEGLYTNLWQVLIHNPKMTATEALIRSNEKGELLGPIGTKIQDALAKLTDAELTILEGKGAWQPGAVLEPPQSLAGSDVHPSFNAPLDRLRRSGELLGVQRTLEIVLPLAQVAPEVLDQIDSEAIVELAQEINGAPRKMLRTPEKVAAIREQRAQQQQLAQTAAAAETVGGIADAAVKVPPATSAMADLMKQAGIEPADVAGFGA